MLVGGVESEAACLAKANSAVRSRVRLWSKMSPVGDADRLLDTPQPMRVRRCLTTAKTRGLRSDSSPSKARALVWSFSYAIVSTRLMVQTLGTAN